MPIDFSAEYSQRSDDELLHLATQRHSLTAEAAAALDAQLRHRNLTDSDRVEYQKFTKRQEHREWRRQRRWKIPGLRPRLTWREILEAFAAMALISVIYVTLPSRYHLRPDWQEAAAIVMITSIMVAFSAISWRKIAFWISLIVSSALQLLLLHAITGGVLSLSWVQRRGVASVGILLFAAVYTFIRFVQRMLGGKGSATSA